MKARVVITADGAVSVFTDEGTLADGKQQIEALFALLQAEGIQLDDISPVEQHRHDGVHIHVGEQIHVHEHGPHTHTH